MAINPLKKQYFPKPPKRKYNLEEYSLNKGTAQPDAPSKLIVSRILLAVFAIGLIGYVLMTHAGVRIAVEVDLSDWQAQTKQSDPDAKDAQMKVLADALMYELTRQGIFPESVEIEDSTISITAPKAPTTGNRLDDMVDNIKDCRVGAFEWEGKHADVEMLRNSASCEGLFDGCRTSVDSPGQPRLHVALTSAGRTHFENFEHTMVFVKAAQPIATITDYSLDDQGNLVIQSSQNTPQKQMTELSFVCDAMRNRDRLAGVAFKNITTSRIGFGLPNF